MIWEYIFGTVLISTIATVLAISNNIFNLRDRLKKWRKKKKKEKFKNTHQENNPDFNFNIGYISNSPPGVCKLTVSFLNISKEIKYMEPLSYHFEFKENKNQYEPPYSVLNGEKWPKRLEHGQRFYVSVDFHHMLNYGIFKYWKKDVQVYATCRSTTGDLLRSNPIDFDKLINCLIPLSDGYRNLALLLNRKYGGTLRDIEASLWQLQIFGRITSHITKQLQFNNIPILQYLNAEHGLELKDNSWSKIYRDLEKKKIPPSIIESFLRSLT